MKKCKQCHQNFEVTDEDRRILNFFDVPDPKLCFHCRLQRRMAFYNRRKLYKNTCELTGKSVISTFSPDKPYKIYNTKDWYSDKWDPLEYGRDFDFSRPFFEQFDELIKDIPHPSLIILGDNENSDYTNDVLKLKNCYLVFDGEQAENCYYGESFVGLKNCMDFHLTIQSELCYETTSAGNCYNLKHSTNCANCSDSWFLRHCRGCKNCFGCVNLVNKEYCIFNEQKTKEEYEAFMANFNSGNYSEVMKVKEKFDAFFTTQHRRAVNGVNNTNTIGHTLANSKNSYYCFESNMLEDCRYCSDCLMGAKDCMDIHVWGNKMEQCYNSAAIGESVRRVMCSAYVSQSCSDVYYSYWCSRNVQNLFGCFGVRQKQYCILNKQYSKEEYEALLPKMIEHMKQTGEWGLFFPSEISPYGYNETLAHESFPFNKEEVIAKGWKWSDYEVQVQADRTIQAHQLPDDIKDIPDDILNWAIVCEVSGKPFKIIPQELKFYREQKLPIPRRHPDQRHLDRFHLKPAFKLYDRTCDNCNKEIKSTYPADAPEKIFCDNCYFKDIY